MQDTLSHPTMQDTSPDPMSTERIAATDGQRRGPALSDLKFFMKYLPGTGLRTLAPGSSVRFHAVRIRPFPYLHVYHTNPLPGTCHVGGAEPATPASGAE